MMVDAMPLTDEQRDLIAKAHNLNPNQRLLYFKNERGKQIPVEFFASIYRCYLAGKINLLQELHWTENGDRTFHYWAIGRYPPFEPIVERARD
jgi:hypothetical protein